MSATASASFTCTHAEYLASKVVADLYQCSRLYGSPTSALVPKYETELVELLTRGYVTQYEFGFKKNDERIVSWRYSVNSAGELTGGKDERAGGVYARADITGAAHYNFMSYSASWYELTSEAQAKIKDSLPFTRTPGSLPGDGNGYWVSDRTYGNGGTSVARETFRPRRSSSRLRSSCRARCSARRNSC